MDIMLRLPVGALAGLAAKPFVLYRDFIRPALEERRSDLEAMYSPVLGRPETDPVILLGITQLLILERMPDRQAVERCMFDVRWRLALGIPEGWKHTAVQNKSDFGQTGRFHW